MAIMLKGHELGLTLTASFEFIHVIEGKPGLNPRGALALIQDHPEFAGLKIEDLADEDGIPTACVVWMKRKNGVEYVAQFTMEDAIRAGLVRDRSGWTKYPANMLRWRAVGFCADVVFPDVLGGMKRTDELGADLSEAGNTIEGEWSVQPPPAPKKQPQANGGFWGTRPWQPETTKRAIAAKAKLYTGPDELTAEDLRQTVINLSKLCSNNDASRYELTEFLTNDEDGENGIRGAKGLSPATAWSIRQWGGAERENNWQPDNDSVVETVAILAHIQNLVEDGAPQDELDDISHIEEEQS